MVFKGFKDENGNVIPVQCAGTVYDEEKNSLALGKGTEAIGKDQLVFGRYNEEDATKAEVVGGGFEGEKAESNVLRLSLAAGHGRIDGNQTVYDLDAYVDVVAAGYGRSLGRTTYLYRIVAVNKVSEYSGFAEGKILYTLSPIDASNVTYGASIMLQDYPYVNQSTECHILDITDGSNAAKILTILDWTGKDAVIAIEPTDDEFSGEAVGVPHYKVTRIVSNADIPINRAGDKKLAVGDYIQREEGNLVAGNYIEIVHGDYSWQNCLLKKIEVGETEDVRRNIRTLGWDGTNWNYGDVTCDNEEHNGIISLRELAKNQCNCKGKADKVTDAVENNLAAFDANGNLKDSGKSLSSLYSSINSKADASQTSSQLGGKADKVTGATSGNLAGLDENGNIKDSGYKPSDFATPYDDTALRTLIAAKLQKEVLMFQDGLQVTSQGGVEVKSGATFDYIGEEGYLGEFLASVRIYNVAGSDYMNIICPCYLTSSTVTFHIGGRTISLTKSGNSFSVTAYKVLDDFFANA